MVFAICWLAAISTRGAVDLVVAGTDSPDPVVTPNNLTYALTITNTGADPATTVSITNVLSSAVSFVSVTTTRGSCSNVAGVVYCDWATVDAGTGGRVTIVARPTAPGIITNLVSAGANEADANGANNSLTQTTTVVNRRTFSSADFIQVQDILASRATPYPSTITVSGITTAVQKVTVTLNNLSHTGPDDLDILLVGPQGGYVMLLSDGQTDPPLVDVIVTFDDAAALPVPDETGLVSGSYRPANYGNIAPDLLPPPAPQVPFMTGFTNLAIFNRTDPNGQWRLFVYDDEPEAGGWIDGWTLTLSTLEVMANLAVATSDSPDPALPGDVVSYTTTITNMGPVNATGVRVTNQAPAGFEVAAYSISRGSCVNGGGTIRCDIGEMAAGTSEQLVVQARAIRGGTYSNRVDVIADQFDPQLENNAASQQTLVEPRVDLRVDVNSSRAPALLEQPIIYTLAVTNLGPDGATGVQVVDQLPPGVLLVNASSTQGSCTNQNGVVTCNLGAIASRGRATIFLTCRPTVLGPITNVATISAEQVDANPANNTAQNLNQVDPVADLQLSMTDAPDPVPLGQPLAYSIVLTNRGPNTASNIVVMDLLPAAVRFVSAQTTHGACTNDGNSVGCLISEFPVGERATVTIVATAISAGVMANSATVTSQPVDANSANNVAAANTLVMPAADISITKAGDQSTVWEGDRVHYTLVVSNHGPSTATSARLNDLLPAATSFVSATASAGSCGFQNGVVTCAFGDLVPGGRVTISVVATVRSAGPLTNTVSAFANEQDLNLGNNVAVAIATAIPRTTTVGDTNTVLLPELGTAPAYPLSINISGLTAAVQRVRVTLPGFSHSYPDDLDLLLVGPGGHAVVLMSDAGGSFGVANLNLSVDDLAQAVLPDSAGLISSPYRPADYEAMPNEFPAPAPQGPYLNTLDVFTRTDPNGTWQLYIVDDAAKDTGILAEGWRLDIWARDSMADLALSTQVSSDLVAVSSNVVVTLTVANNGPGLASGVTVSNAHGANLLFNAAAASQGSCTNDAGLVQCALGELAPGSSALVQMSFLVTASGTISNATGVAGSSLDLAPLNNTSVTSFVAENPPVILTQPRHQFPLAGGTAVFEVLVAGDPPLNYQWFWDETAIPGANAATLTINDVQLEVLGDYRLQVSNRVASVLSDVARLAFPSPPAIEPIADHFTGEDQPIIVHLPISDANAPFDSFQFFAECADTNLAPTTNMSFIVSGTNYALAIVPGTNQFGTNIITVTVTDLAGLTASQTFTLGVESVNDYPVFTVPVGDQVMDEDGSITVLFEVADAETPASALIIGARSYNEVLMPNSLLGPWGPGGNPYITITPASNQFGTALLEVRVRDEAGVRTTNLFTLTVLPVEDAPTISAIDDITVPEDGGFRVDFVVGDVETAAADLLVSAESSNPALIANDAFTLDGSGSSRGLSARPVADEYGNSRITIFVRDGADVVSSRAFWVTVDPVNDAPFVSEIPEVLTAIDQTSAEVAFTISDLESDADSLTLTAFSTNTALAPVSGIEFAGSGSTRTVRVTPGTGEFGWTMLTVEVADPDGGVTTRDFELIVNTTSGPPVIVLEPQGQGVMIGSPVTLRVAAAGPGPLTYQWQRNGEELTGQTNRVLSIASVVGADRGEYRVRVTNPQGSVTSAPAQLMVREQTRILSLTRVGGTVELTFGTVAGLKYYVEFQDSLGAAWSALPEVIGTGGVVTATDPAAGVSTRFYRVRIE